MIQCQIVEMKTLFALGLLLLSASAASAQVRYVECSGGTDTVTGGLHRQTLTLDLTNNTGSSRDHSATVSRPFRITLNSPSQLRMRDGDYVMVLDRETLVMQRSYAGSPLKDKTCKVVDGPRVRTQI